MTRNARLVATASVLATLAAFCVLRFEVTTDITSFLDAPGSAVQGALSRRLSRSEATRTMVLSVGAAEPAQARAAANALAEQLARDPDFVWVAAGPDPDLLGVLESVYFPHRYQLATERPEAELPERLADAGLARTADDLRAALAGPLAPIVRNVATRDPLMAWPALLRRLQGASAPALRVRDGNFTTREDDRAIVFARTAYPALDSAAHAPVLSRLEQAFSEEKARAGGGLEIEMSAVQRFAVRAATAMRGDISRISTLSTIGILILFFATLRSPRLIALSSLPLAAGLLCGLAACLALNGRVNGLTLAFGGALVGVVIDYPLHLFAHWLTGGPDEDGGHALARVWPGIRLGAATSFVGFAALAGAGFPGIREIGLFAGAGIAGAVAFTAVAMPLLVPPRASGPTAAVGRREAAALSRSIRWLGEHRSAAAVLPALAIAVCAAGLPGARFTDEVSALSPVNPELVAEEQRVRDRVLGADTSRTVIALGPDFETALQRNDAVAARLAEGVAAGELAGFQSLHDFLWSANLQDRNLRAFAEAPALADRTLSALARAGFVAEAFEPFRASLQQRPPPLDLEALLASPLQHWITPFLLPEDEPGGDPAARFAIATRVRGVDSPARLEARVADLEGVVFLDQLTLLTEGYRGLRRAATRMIAFGVLAVLALLWLHYRSLGATAIALVPALLAAGTTAAAIALAGQPLNLVHLFGLLLTLGMGVDYGVFLAESVRQREPAGATALGLLGSCATSVLGLGLLALSSNPGLRSLGVTTAAGVVSSLLLGPTVLALLGPRSKSSESS